MTQPRRRRITPVDDRLEEECADVVRSRVAEEAGTRLGPIDELPVGQRPWSRFDERQDRTQHRRRLFVAKFNPVLGGDPALPPAPGAVDLWDPLVPNKWVNDEPRNGDKPGTNHVPDLDRAMAGDLILVMRLPFRGSGVDEEGPWSWRASDDESPFAGRRVLVGVWYVTRRVVRRLPYGPNRPTTTLWHLPLVRFADEDAVDVPSLLALDPTMETLTPFHTSNWYFVGCATGDEEARLAAACSLPSDVFTEPDVYALRRRLAGLRCGMQDRHRKYWQDIRYHHKVRVSIEETAVRRAEHALAKDGRRVIGDKQGWPGWGGDLDCQGITSDGWLDKLCLEVKGTRYDPWPGHVMLQRSQRDRATRTATGRPDPGEEGYDWQLWIQAGIPTDHLPKRDGQLPPLEKWDARRVHEEWKATWVK
jgi:hypothetical protein